MHENDKCNENKVYMYIPNKSYNIILIAKL